MSSAEENEKQQKFDFEATEEAAQMAKNDFRFVDEVAFDYRKSPITQSMFSDYTRLFINRQKINSELSEI